MRNYKEVYEDALNQIIRRRNTSTTLYFYYILLTNDKIAETFKNKYCYFKELFYCYENGEIDLRFFMRNINDRYYDYIDTLMKDFQLYKEYKDLYDLYKNHRTLFFKNLFDGTFARYQRLALN